MVLLLILSVLFHFPDAVHHQLSNFSSKFSEETLDAQLNMLCRQKIKDSDTAGLQAATEKLKPGSVIVKTLIKLDEYAANPKKSHTRL